MQTRFVVTLLALPAMLALHLALQGQTVQPPQASIGTPARKAAPGATSQQPQHILTQSFPVAPKPKPPTPKPATTTATPQPATPAPAPVARPHPSTRLPESASTLPGAINRNVIVLDPAHGGIDSGSRIGDNILEKDVALALAFKLRSMLTARGFNVIMTRDSDAPNGDTPPAGTPPAVLALDDRAGIANHARASACLLLHATGSGLGVHLYSSELAQVPVENQLLPWLTAQAAWVPQSGQLEKALATALTRARIPLVVSAASVRPVDSLTCPALVIELAPRTSDVTTINDAGYQQRIAESIASALIFWQNQVQPPTRDVSSSGSSSPAKAAQP